MKNDSSAQMQNQALDLEIFSKNQDKALALLDACSLSMDLAKSLALRTALSIDENDIPKEEIIPMGIALQCFLQNIVLKIEDAQKLTEVDMNKTCQSIRGIMLCLKETLRDMNLNKSHTCNIFFLVGEAMEMFSVDVEALSDDVLESKNLVLSAYKQVAQNNKNTLTRPSSQRAANDPRDAA